MLTNILSEAGDDGEDGLDVGGDVRHLAQCVQHRPSNHLPARVHFKVHVEKFIFFTDEERFDV